MALASMRVFCTPTEFTDWMRALAKRFDLGCITFRDSSQYGLLAERPEEIQTYDDAYAVCLYPGNSKLPAHLTMNDVRTREWGWVYARPGRLFEWAGRRILTLSDVVGEDFEYEPVHPARYVRWLKRRTAGVRTSGVLATNAKFGGEWQRYHDISYTDGAKQLHREGVVWKQFRDGNVVFKPGTATDDCGTSSNKA